MTEHDLFNFLKKNCKRPNEFDFWWTVYIHLWNYFCAGSYNAKVYVSKEEL